MNCFACLPLLLLLILPFLLSPFLCIPPLSPLSLCPFLPFLPPVCPSVLPPSIPFSLETHKTGRQIGRFTVLLHTHPRGHDINNPEKKGIKLLPTHVLFIQAPLMTMTDVDDNTPLSILQRLVLFPPAQCHTHTHRYTDEIRRPVSFLLFATPILSLSSLFLFYSLSLTLLSLWLCCDLYENK